MKLYYNRDLVSILLVWVNYESNPIFLDVIATFGLVSGQTKVSSDVTSKYGKLSEPYLQGFVLETFKAVPGVGKTGWNASETPYQGVFSRPHGYGIKIKNDCIWNAKEAPIRDHPKCKIFSGHLCKVVPLCRNWAIIGRAHTVKFWK